MTVPVDLPAMVAAGSFLTLLGHRLVEHSPAGERLTIVLATGWTAWYLVPAGYFCFLYPDWMWSYLVDISVFPTWLWFFAFWAAMVGCGYAGARIAANLIKSGRTRWVWAVAVGAMLVYSVVLALTFDEYTHIGTYDEYHAGAAEHMTDAADFQRAMNVIGVFLVVPFVAIAGYLVVRGRSVGSDDPTVTGPNSGDAISNLGSPEATEE